MNHFVLSLASLLPPLFSGFTKSVILLLVALATIAILRRQASAANRHVLLAMALLSLALFPLLPLMVSFVPPLLKAVPVPEPSARIIPAPLPSPVAVAPQAAVPATPVKPPAPVSPSLLSSEIVAAGAVSVWAIGVFLCLIRLGVSLVGLRHLLRRCHPAEFHPQTAAVLDPFKIQLYEANAEVPLPTPVTLGIARWPLLIVPAGALAEWPEERRRAVLLHEMAHIARNDGAIHILSQIICSVYWCNPLVWIARGHLGLLAEQACDDCAVVHSGLPAPDYARHLLDVAQEASHNRQRYSAMALGMTSPQGLRARVTSLLEKRQKREAANPRWIVGTLLTTVAGFLLFVALRPADGKENVRQIKTVEPGSKFTRTTSDGYLRIDLLAVTTAEETDDDNSPWWTPDGKPLAAPPQVNRLFHGIRTGGPENAQDRSLLFRLTATKPLVAASTVGMISDPERQLTNKLMATGRDLRLDDTKIQPGEPAEGLVHLRLKSAPTTGTYRFGVATGEWKTISRIPFTQTVPPPIPAKSGKPAEVKLNIDLGDKPVIQFSVSKEQGYWNGYGKPLDLLGPNPPLTDNEARRVILMDADGTAIPTQSGSMGYDGSASATVASSDWKRIAYVDLQTRPYEWLEFSGITFAMPGELARRLAETPKPVPREQVRGAARRDLPGGYAVTLVALTRRKTDGGGWWAPDGTPLTGPLQGEEKTTQFTGWPANQHPRALFLSLSGPKNANVSVATQLDGGEPNPWSGTTQLYEGRNQIGMFRQFAPEAKTTTLRFGLGTGDWQTVSTIPQSLTHTTITPRDSGTEYGGDVEIEISTEPKVAYRDARGNSQVRYFITENGHKLAPDVAQRVVAVLKDGRTLPLTTCAHGSESVSFIWLNLDSGGAAYRYNTVTLPEIKAFRLETRSYRWTTIQNIALAPRP